MKKELNQIFKEIENIETPQGLDFLILSRISELRQKQIRQKLFWSRASLMGSFGAFFWAVFSYGQTFLSSDFWIIFRLLLTDASDVFRNWNDFLFSLLETFPVFSTIIMLVPILAMLVSFFAYVKLIQRNSYNLRLS